MKTWVFATDRYRLEVSADGRWATVNAPGARSPLRLSLLASLNTIDGPDETIGLGAPEVAMAAPVDEGEATPATVTVRRRSTRWASAATIVRCGPENLSIWAEVEGEGRLGTVTLLGGHSLMPDALGRLRSGAEVPYLFSPNPEDPRLVVHPAVSPAVVGGAGDGLPGRGHWFFTPAPFYFALGEGRRLVAGTANTAGAADRARAGGWAGLGLLGPVHEFDWTEVAYVPADQAFDLELAYEGHRKVEGRFRAPGVVVMPGLANPYDGLRAHRRQLLAEGDVRPRPASRRPLWWSRPIFCGWGAQCYLATQRGTAPQEECTAANYDRFLAELAAQDVLPGTVVIDDGWQAEYGRAAPDQGRWPDLRAWVAARHEAGQRVLMWWKAWDPAGVPADWCITNPEGAPVAIDPGHPDAARLVQGNVTELLSPHGFDADGLKVDFTGRTPSGSALRHVGTWGIALLHQHLEHVYQAAKKAKEDALVITHAANPAFVDVGDMVRLNDILRLDEAQPESPVVYQMKYRASVARAACPELLIDTDDWCAPDLAQWREYMSVKADLGVPALYYTTHIDRTGEALQAQDYALIRKVFSMANEGGQ